MCLGTNCLQPGCLQKRYIYQTGRLCVFRVDKCREVPGNSEKVERGRKCVAIVATLKESP
jgi:hypothetical protein